MDQYQNVLTLIDKRIAEKQAIVDSMIPSDKEGFVILDLMLDMYIVEMTEVKDQLIEAAKMAPVVCKDDDGHTYEVPSFLVVRFNQLMDDIWNSEPRSDERYDAHDRLTEEFGQYQR